MPVVMGEIGGRAYSNKKSVPSEQGAWGCRKDITHQLLERSCIMRFSAIPQGEE